MLGVVWNIFKVNSKDIRTVWMDVVLRSLLLTLNIFRNAFGLLIRCFCSSLGMYLSVSSKHLPVQNQQRHSQKKYVGSWKERYQNSVSVFFLVSLWSPLNIFCTFMFFSFSIADFQKVSVWWVGAFFCTAITNSASTACPKQLNHNVFYISRKQT